MNSKIFFSCILCNKIGVSFQCERCNETYCSKDCQVIHWPIHRRMCIPMPMPNLIPLDNSMILLNQSASHQCSATKQYSTQWKSNDLGESVQKVLAKPNHNQIVSRESRFLAHLSPEKLADSYSGRSGSLLEFTIEPNVQSKKWFEEFLFGEVTEVVVQYFTESPSITCWVIQRNDIDRRNAILKSLNCHRSFDTLDSDNIKINTMYSVQFEGVCHRGVVLHRINSSDVWVRLIDHGRSYRASVSAIRTLLQAVPTHLKGLAFEINFETLRSIRVDEVLRVENVSHNSDEAIDVRFVEEEEKIFTDKDIESIPLPVDVSIELFCLDYSNIDNGYISACEIDDKRLKSISRISDKIMNYCKGTGCDKDYCPKLNELCLAYAQDGQWYRAKCVENVMPNVFRLEMIDYGSIEDVSSQNIRKMVEDFINQPSIMQQCTIFGVPQKPEKATTNKIVAYFRRHPIFSIKRARLSGGKYNIYLPDLLKLIDE